MKDLSLHLMDIAQNATEAGAAHVKVSLVAEEGSRTLAMTVSDDGRGMDAAFLARVTDPFTTTRTTRKVGLGIPLLKLAAELTGGYLDIVSEAGVGSSLKSLFRIDQVDRIPVGDMGGTMAALMTAWTEIGWVLHLGSENGEFDLTTDEIKEILGDVPLGSPAIAGWLEDTIREAMTNVFGGVLDEITEGS